MSSPRVPKRRGLLQINQDLVRSHARHPEWFHVFKEGEQVKINVNVYRLPVPDRAMVADWVGAALGSKTSLSLVFGQMPPNTKRMTGALLVQMSLPDVRRALFGTAEFVEAVDAYAAHNQVTPTFQAPTAELYPPERIVTERAKILLGALGTDEAEFRFYWTSQTDIQVIANSEKADLVYPIVEVRFPAEQLVHLMHTVDKLVGKEVPSE
jgi:hypothetical protein